MTRRDFLLAFPPAASLEARQAPGARLRIQQVDVIHHTHTDVGYTDLPSVVRDKQIRYLEAAIELCRTQPSFRWTVESLIELDDWWAQAPAARRDEFLRLVKAGRIDVMGLPFNQTPLLEARQWDRMLEWIPASLWRAVAPRAAMQNDVNGFPRAGARRLLDRGIGHLLMGINADSGGPPFFRPSAFWWKQPDGRRLFVWLGEHYGSAMAHLGARRIEGLADDEASVRAAHARLTERLAQLEAQGYPYDRLILTFTHPDAYDNGPPAPYLAPFVDAWNRLGLVPRLRLTTATQAVLEMEARIGKDIPTKEGEWTDWWANGSASGPREVAASREAKRAVAASLSPVWGPLPPSAQTTLNAVLKDLCLFDEHTWGASSSISAPWSLNTQAQFTEKSELAYRAMGQAAWLLERRARTRLEGLEEGLYVVNPSPAEWSGWAAIEAALLSGEYRSLTDAATGERLALEKDGRHYRFWVEKLGPHSWRRFRLETEPAPAPDAGAEPELRIGAAGWPEAASWQGMSKPLWEGALGDFLAMDLIPPADRRTITSLHANPDADARAALRARTVRLTQAYYEEARKTVTAETVRFTQRFRHPRLEGATREVELWRRQPRARLTVRFDRVSSLAPEVFYLAFDLPRGSGLPRLWCGGMPFVPYRDQLPGACRDYFAIDGWALYSQPGGDWLWVTRDAPLVAVGGPHALERHQDEPAEPRRIVAILFDNCWHTNFVADSHGTMEFRFDLAWREKIAAPGDLAEALAAAPVVLPRRRRPVAPEILRTIYRP